MNSSDKPKLVLSVVVIAIFAAAFFRHPDNALLVGALITMAGTAVNYWLGSSKGSADKSTHIEQLTAGPQPVEVVNSAKQPVPTTASGATEELPDYAR